jgi:tol-pal system protein YbgF
MKKIRFAVLLVLIAVPSWTYAGTKEEIVRLQSDVLQLQEQIRLLQKSTDDNGSVIRSLLEQLNDQIARNNLAMDNLALGLNAQKTDVGTAMTQVKQEIQKLSVKLDDTNNRIAGLYQRIEESQVKTASLRYVPSAEGGGGGLEPDQVYSQAYNDYLMGNYDLAISGFQDFLTNYPSSEYADNAMHYLAVCYFQQGRFEQAAQTFDQVINLYPQGDKTPVAYFKKAAAYQALQKNNEAVEAYGSLITLFPDSQEAKLARVELDKMGVAPPTPAAPGTPAARRRGNR